MTIGEFFDCPDFDETGTLTTGTECVDFDFCTGATGDAGVMGIEVAGGGAGAGLGAAAAADSGPSGCWLGVGAEAICG